MRNSTYFNPKPAHFNCNDFPDSKDTLTVAHIAAKLRVWKHEPEKEPQYKEYKTAPKMLATGMYACYYCGRINCIDDSQCTSCGEDKFILRL